MRGSKGDIPVAVAVPEATIRQAEWGGINVEIGEIAGDLDVAPFFQGLPNDECQCPHWGYVIKGTLRYRSRDREEVFSAGDAYYVGPGHIPVYEAGLEYVEFSPADVLQQTMEVVERNMMAMGAQ
ncbi:MAG: hypothetical protein U0232_21710 [Thermomicrobiales bacterium]